MESLSQTYYHKDMENTFEITVDFKKINFGFYKVECEKISHYRASWTVFKNYCGQWENLDFNFLDGNSFKIDFLRIKTQLNEKNFEGIVEKLKKGKKNIFDFICELTGNKKSSSIEEICLGVPLNSYLNISFYQINTMMNYLPTINFEIEKFNFTAKRLFMIKREKFLTNLTKEAAYNAQFKLEFMFTKGNENILGMNFLEGKLVSFDSFSSRVNLGDASFLNDFQDSKFSTYLALKVTIDIFIFIFMITLIFAAIINFDKFLNEEE